jgi:hypothetical protein
MTVNRFLPHIYVLPEDDANRQLVNGFVLDSFLSTRKIHVLEEAGGWNAVLERFCLVYAAEMDRYQNRFMILLIDFDEHEGRLEEAKARIPAHLADRVFILGAWSEPEELRREIKLSYEELGISLAQDCREETNRYWGHRLLKHNAAEVSRLRQSVKAILFPTL